jgi:hypothetical protein
MLKAFHYLHFALWRACRASRDASFGEFRVQALLGLIEINFVSGVLFLIPGDHVANLNLPAYLLATVVPLFALNVYLFWDAKKREKYEWEFAMYPLTRRRTLDVLTFLVAIGAIFLPVIGHLSN